MVLRNHKTRIRCHRLSGPGGVGFGASAWMDMQARWHRRHPSLGSLGSHFRTPPSVIPVARIRYSSPERINFPNHSDAVQHQHSVLVGPTVSRRCRDRRPAGTPSASSSRRRQISPAGRVEGIAILEALCGYGIGGSIPPATRSPARRELDAAILLPLHAQPRPAGQAGALTPHKPRRRTSCVGGVFA